MKCQNCDHDPAAPVYVGPGDEVRNKESGKPGTVVMATKQFIRVLYSGFVWDGHLARALTTIDGRPVAGYRDPRDERIKELEAEVANYGSEHVDELQQRIDEQEVRLMQWATKDSKQRRRLDWADARIGELEKSANPLAGLTDTEIHKIVRASCKAWGNFGLMGWVDDIAKMLRDIRDGKLEVPK